MRRMLTIVLASFVAAPTVFAGNPIRPEHCTLYSQGPSGTKYWGRSFSGYDAREQARKRADAFNELEDLRKRREGPNYRRVIMDYECVRL